MSMVLPELPEKLKSLNSEEERIQRESLLLLQGDKETSEELELLEGTLDAVFSAVVDEKQSEADPLAIQMVGARLFNSVAVSLKLVLRGYYQGSFSIQRDVVEIAFLLRYFAHEPKMLERWRTCSSRERQRLFGPAKIRQALDKRNGFKNQKRDKFYQDFCEYAAHPTYSGMLLLAPTGSVKLGPFLRREFLRQCLWELTRLATYAAVQLLAMLPADLLSTQQTQLAFIEKAKAWRQLQATKKRMPQ